MIKVAYPLVRKTRETEEESLEIRVEEAAMVVLKATTLALILVSLCAKILNNMALLVWLGSEHCVRIGPATMLELMKSDQMC